MAAPPLDPLRLAILKNRTEALRQIRTPTCYFDVKPSSVSIDPQEILLVPKSERPFFLVQPVPEGVLDFERAGEVHEQFVFAVIAIADAENFASDDPARRITVAEWLIADIERAFTAAAPFDVSCGGLCVDVVPQRPRPFFSIGVDFVVLEQFWTASVYRLFGQP